MNPLYRSWLLDQAGQPREPQPWHSYRGHGGLEAFRQRQLERLRSAQPERKHDTNNR